MTELLTAAQMRAIEQAAIASGEVTGLELMERAGRGVVEAIFEEWPELKATSHRAVVLCGPGNNGGDGFVVARLLKEWGWEVEVFLYGDPEKLPPDARVNYERWLKLSDLSDWSLDRITTTRANLYVDAVFGAGLARVPSDQVLEPLTALYASSKTFNRLVAIDAPTGLCMDSGRALVSDYGAVFGFLTVTFHLPRPGHFLQDGPFHCGKLKVKPIGLSKWDKETSGLELAGVDYIQLMKHESDHKYAHGHALILSGPPSQTGAARLAARGALRIGAGLVTVGAAPEAIPEHAAQINAIMLRPVADAAELERILEDKRINALCLGPGLGLDQRARRLVAAALGEEPAPGLTRGLNAGGEPVGARGLRSSSGRGQGRRKLVLDADALTILAQDPALFAALHENCVLTPHGGEFARLFPDIAEKLAAPATKGPAYSKVDATREAAKRAGCVVLYKGPDTVIADPSGRCSISSAHYERAAPWLATAGSGDVLAGFIAGLLARGFSPMAAAEAAAWLHVECALKFGPGLIAEDLPEQLPAVFRAMGL